MLYKLLYSLQDIYSPFNIFRYITFRTALSVITALIITFLMAPWLIERLKKRSLTQQVRDDGPQTHLSKTGTPTMGGIMIILSVVLSVLMWGDLSNKYMLVMLTAIIGFGLIGLTDDYLKNERRDSKGLKARYKFSLQIILALFVGLLFYNNPEDQYAAMLNIPFFKKWLIDMGW